MNLPQVQPTTNLRSFLNRTNQYVRGNAVESGNDIVAVKTARGTVLKLNPKFKDQSIPFIRWRGEWDVNASYAKGDLVYVSANKSYTSGSYAPSVSPGTWICEVAHPDKLVSDALKGMGYTSAGLEYVQYIRNDSVEYFPKFPEPAQTASYHTSTGRYWKLISGAGVATYTCEDGIENPTYVDMTKSGSTTLP
jgi:hypothetical protein